MGKGFFYYILFIFIITPVFSQGELNTESEIFFRDEKTLALMLNSNGFGVNMSYAKRLNAFHKTMYQVDMVGIKHPKEIKLNNPIFQTGGSFVYGKLNKFYVIRTGIGKQKEIYRKIDKGGISIRRYYSCGLNLGFEKPVYYIVQEYLSTSEAIIKVRKFDASQHASNDIIKNASYFKGFNELKLIPGGYIKGSLMFEYGKYDEILHALEGGVAIDVFSRGIEIMARNKPDVFFISLFISYRFGKVVDSRFKSKKNKIDKIVSE